MKLKETLFHIFSFRRWITAVVTFIKDIPHIIRHSLFFSIFFFLLLYYIFGKVITLLTRIPVIGVFIKKAADFWQKRLNVVDKMVNRLEHVGTSVNRSYLIELALKNLVARRTRSLVTVFGMSVGIGIIVLLLSLGYGIERLIINRVASLDELRMFDVSAGANGNLRLDNNLIKKIGGIDKVETTIPLVATVGKLSYKNSTTDVLVYAASKKYMEYSKIKIINGDLFTNATEYNSSSKDKLTQNGESVMGVSSELQKGTYDKQISSGTVYFNLIPGQAVSVWKNCEVEPPLLGYTTRNEGGYSGEEYWGGTYAPFVPHGRIGYDGKANRDLGKWIRAKLPLYERRADGSIVPVFDKLGRHTWETGCIQETSVQILDKLAFAEVLGESTGSASLTASIQGATESAVLTYDEVIVASNSAGLEFVSLQASEEAALKTDTQKTVTFTNSPDGEAVVSSGLLNLLNIPVSDAVGTIFKVQFIITKSLLPTIEGRALSPETEYKITGVSDDSDATVLYIPHADIEKLKVNNFSQIKVIMNDKDALSKARKSVEVLGLTTSSTIDTVNQIESLFGNVRIVLGIVGMVALVVASLGMFNTLTVSLLERTREIGGMKTMGVVSEEIQDLFLAEAVIMGISGGLGGLLLGYLIGKSLSIGVSIFALTRGQGFLELTYIPPAFIAFIMLSSFFVGIITGIYPARRAKKISALNALRYE